VRKRELEERKLWINISPWGKKKYIYFKNPITPIENIILVYI